MITTFIISVCLGDNFGLVRTQRLMYDQIRYAGSTWDVSAWTGPEREGSSDYVVIKADGNVVFSTKGQEEISRLGIGFLTGADEEPYIVYRKYTYAGSGAWTTIFRMRRGGHLQEIFKEDWFDSAFGSNRDLGGPVFRDLDGDGREEWIWDSFSSYEGQPPKWLVAFKPDGQGVLQVWKKYPNREKVFLPRLAGVASEGDRDIYFVNHLEKWFK